jgi:hypothetical protein
MCVYVCACVCVCVGVGVGRARDAVDEQSLDEQRLRRAIPHALLPHALVLSHAKMKVEDSVNPKPRPRLLLPHAEEGEDAL